MTCNADVLGWASLRVRDQTGEQIARFDSPVVPHVGEIVAARGARWRITDIEWDIPAEAGTGPTVHLRVAVYDGKDT